MMPIPGRTSCSTSEELLAYFARVSNAANQDKHATGPKLIRRLIKDNEWSPLDMVCVTFEIQTSRRISRQILRHWSARFQEFSQRWATLDEQTEPYYSEARMAVKGNRALTVEAEEELKIFWKAEQKRIWNFAWERYQEALKRGQHPEDACVVLPEGMAPSRLYAQGSLRTWLHYSLLRTKPQTQREHRTIAQSLWDEIGKFYPTLYEAGNQTD